MNQERVLHRRRIVFSRGEAVKYVGHLDLMRAWERALRRAQAPLAYSQGFNPHPRLTLALPLPVGCTGEVEELDVLLTEPLPPAALADCLCPVMPPGIRVVEVRAVDLHAPARPSCVRRVDYRVALDGVSVEAARRAVDDLLSQDQVPVEFQRKRYDLRPLIDDLSVVVEEGRVAIEMALLCDAQGRIGRPDAVLQSLGLEASLRSIHRRRIVFDC